MLKEITAAVNYCDDEAGFAANLVDNAVGPAKNFTNGRILKLRNCLATFRKLLQQSRSPDNLFFDTQRVSNRISRDDPNNCIYVVDR